MKESVAKGPAVFHPVNGNCLPPALMVDQGLVVLVLPDLTISQEHLELHIFKMRISQLKYFGRKFK